jgi:hypothetical protein
MGGAVACTPHRLASPRRRRQASTVSRRPPPRALGRRPGPSVLHRPIIPVLHHAAGKAADITIFDPDTIGAKLCHKLPVFASEFTRSPDELNCRNGVLNLQTGELTPHQNLAFLHT